MNSNVAKLHANSDNSVFTSPACLKVVVPVSCELDGRQIKLNGNHLCFGLNNFSANTKR